MTGRILVVDDDRAMVRTLCDILSLRGWETMAAHSGTEAVAAAEQERYRYVLMDIRMPGLDGVTAMKQMKQSRPDLDVVLMTAHTAPETVTEAEQAGVLRVITKPIDMPGLLELLVP